MPYQKIINEFITIVKDIIGERLTGIYLHGSMAMGCFNPAKSDIDLIVVIEDSISDGQKMQFMNHVIRLNRQAPSKGLEISIVKREYCAPFVYPTPYELHFSPAHLQWFLNNPQDYIANMKGVDIDLAAHFTIINHYGIVLCGEEIGKVFSAVPRQDYIDSICADIESAKEDIIQQPVYTILNLCRVLAYLRDGLYLSKAEGGKWAIDRLVVEDLSFISNALECYRSDNKIILNKDDARIFAEKMLSLIFEVKTEERCTEPE